MTIIRVENKAANDLDTFLHDLALDERFEGTGGKLQTHL